MNTRPQPAENGSANQPPPLDDLNLYEADVALREAVARHGAGWAEQTLRDFGAVAGRPETAALAEAANRHPPVLRTHDRTGERLDLVEFHSAYHELMALGCSLGVHSSPWAEPRPGAQAARAALYFLYGQVENGTQCPLTMTYAAAPVLARHAQALPALGDDWLPRIHARRYDRRFLPVAQKEGATLGMGMTERQGGSDVRSNLTRAVPRSSRGPGRAYRIDGEKWFFSAPMCDAFLVLAQAAAGLSCFFLPRFLPEGAVNGIRLRRLKDKLGNRSNASAEAEFHGATGWLLGEEGRGIPVILEMVNHTRLDCVLGSAALMRQALVQALHHARHREAFGRRLAEQPLMRNVLADLALESEAATALALRLAAAYDSKEEGEVALRRLLTPAAKFWVCKRAATFAQEAMEVLGGNGYVEESPLPRIYREAPLNSIWEGSGNVMCLDVLRAVRAHPESVEALLSAIAPAAAAEPRLSALAASLAAALRAADDESAARRVARDVALAMQAALLLGHAPAAVAGAFCASRLDGGDGRAFGTLPALPDGGAILDRALPA